MSKVMSVPVIDLNLVDTCSAGYVHVVDPVALKTKVLASKMHKQLGLATWNVSDFCVVSARLLTC